MECRIRWNVECVGNVSFSFEIRSVLLIACERGGVDFHVDDNSFYLVVAASTREKNNRKKTLRLFKNFYVVVVDDIVSRWKIPNHTLQSSGNRGS